MFTFTIGITVNILIVLTKHGKLGNTGKNTGFLLERFAAPYCVFKDAGAKMMLASPQGGQLLQEPSANAPESQTANTAAS